MLCGRRRLSPTYRTSMFRSYLYQFCVCMPQSSHVLRLFAQSGNRWSSAPSRSIFLCLELIYMSTCRFLIRSIHSAIVTSFFLFLLSLLHSSRVFLYVRRVLFLAASYDNWRAYVTCVSTEACYYAQGVEGDRPVRSAYPPKCHLLYGS